MQQSSPITLYQQALDAGGYQPDDVQRRAVARLETIYQALNQYQMSLRPVQVYATAWAVYLGSQLDDHP